MKKAILALLLSLSLVFVLAFSSAASETEASPVAYTDEDGNPKMCYRILIRYMGFPQDGFKLHKIDWL